MEHLRHLRPGDLLPLALVGWPRDVQLGPAPNAATALITPRDETSRPRSPPGQAQRSGVGDVSGRRRLLASCAMPFPDWGNVPGWLGAGSLLLAFRLFLRDRADRERAQVDLVGVWCGPKYERRPPFGERVEEGSLEWFVRNGSQVPVQVVQLAYEVRTKWMVRDLAQWIQPPGQPAIGPWDIRPGTSPIRAYLEGIRVPPQDTWRQENRVNFAHQAPDHADQPDPLDGLTYEIRWVLLVDNAGRRWKARPSSGHRTRRVRWYSWRHRDYPLTWRRPTTLWLNRRRHQALDLGRRGGRFGLRQWRRVLGR